MILHSKRELVMKREGRSWPVDLNKAPSCYEAAILTICHPLLLVGLLNFFSLSNSQIFKLLYVLKCVMVNMMSSLCIHLAALSGSACPFVCTSQWACWPAVCSLAYSGLATSTTSTT